MCYNSTDYDEKRWHKFSRSKCIPFHLCLYAFDNNYNWCRCICWTSDDCVPKNIFSRAVKSLRFYLLISLRGEGLDTLHTSLPTSGRSIEAAAFNASTYSSIQLPVNPEKNSSRQLFTICNAQGSSIVSFARRCWASTAVLMKSTADVDASTSTQFTFR